MTSPAVGDSRKPRPPQPAPYLDPVRTGDDQAVEGVKPRLDSGNCLNSLRVLGVTCVKLDWEPSGFVRAEATVDTITHYARAEGLQLALSLLVDAVAGPTTLTMTDAANRTPVTLADGTAGILTYMDRGHVMAHVRMLSDGRVRRVPVALLRKA